MTAASNEPGTAEREKTRLARAVRASVAVFLAAELLALGAVSLPLSLGIAAGYAVALLVLLFFSQARETANPYYARVPEVVQLRAVLAEQEGQHEEEPGRESAERFHRAHIIRAMDMKHFFTIAASPALAYRKSGSTSWCSRARVNTGFSSSQPSYARRPSRSMTKLTGRRHIRP